MVIRLITRDLRQKQMLNSYIEQYQASRHRKLAAVMLAHLDWCLREDDVISLQASIEQCSEAELITDAENQHAEANAAVFVFSYRVLQCLKHLPQKRMLLIPFYRLDLLLWSYLLGESVRTVPLSVYGSEKRLQTYVVCAMLKQHCCSVYLSIDTYAQVRWAVFCRVLGLRVMRMHQHPIQVSQSKRRYEPFMRTLVEKLTTVHTP